MLHQFDIDLWRKIQKAYVSSTFQHRNNLQHFNVEVGKSFPQSTMVPWAYRRLGCESVLEAHTRKSISICFRVGVVRACGRAKRSCAAARHPAHDRDRKAPDASLASCAPPIPARRSSTPPRAATGYTLSRRAPGSHLSCLDRTPAAPLG